MPWTRKLRVADPRRLLLEDADELGADRLALGLGLAQPGQALEEAVLGVDGHERHLEVVAEGGDDLLALVLAHQPVVDEHARQLVADRAVHEQRGDARVHAAREPADHAAVADLGADRGDLLVDDRLRAPRALAAADVLEERRQHLLAVGRVDDLGVELDPVEAALDVLQRGDGRLGRARQRGEARRRLVDRVAVRHPARLLGRRAGQQPARLGDGQPRAAELADLGALDPPAERQHERLHAVADAEHGDPELEQLRIQPRRALRVHGGGAAGEDQALRVAAADLLDADVVRQQLGEDAALAHAAGDQLRVLPAVVEDDDLVGRDRPLERELLDALLGRERGAAALGDELRHRPASTGCGCGLRVAAGAHADRLVALERLALGLQRRGDHQLGPVELGDVLVAAGRHRGPQAAHQVERAVVLAGRARDDLLERAVLRRRHARAARERRVERRHAPVEAVARRLVGARQRRADHHRVGAAGDRLRDVAARAHAAVGDHAAVVARLEHVLRARGRHVGDRGRLRDADAEHAAGGARRAGADADEHAGRARAHEVQARVVAGTAAEHDGDRQLAHELLEVEHVTLARDVLGRDHGALHDQDVQPRVQRQLVPALDLLRGQRRGGDDAVRLDLLDALRDQLLLDRLLVDLLHLPGGLVARRRPAMRSSIDVRVLVAGPDALEVQDGEAAEAADDARGLRRDDAVHRGGEQRELEAVRAERPGDVDVVGVARPARRDDRYVIESIGAARLLASADLDLHGGILGVGADGVGRHNHVTPLLPELWPGALPERTSTALGREGEGCPNRPDFHRAVD